MLNFWEDYKEYLAHESIANTYELEQVSNKSEKIK